jgi:protein TonB
MDRSRILYLITLEAMGSMNEQASTELLNAMQKDKDFPWAEMGVYQNLSALLSMLVNQETPEKSIKEKLFNKIVTIKQEKASTISNTELPKEKQSAAAKEEEQGIEENDIPDELLVQDENKKSAVKIVDHLDDFEQVKSKLIKIKDVQNNPAAKPEIKKTDKEKIPVEEFEEIPFEKNPKPRKSKTAVVKKKYIIAASIFFVMIAAFGFFYFNFFNNDIEKQMQRAEKETEMIIAQKRTVPQEQQQPVSFENIEQSEQIEGGDQDEQVGQVKEIEIENNQQEELPLKIEESKEYEIPPEMIETRIETESQKPVIPPLPKTPDFIEAPLIVEEVKSNEKKEAVLLESTTPGKQLPPTEEKVVEEEPVYFVAVEEMPEPIGGISEIQKNIVYPEIAKRAGLEGKVLVRAFVNESGNVTKTEVIKGIGLGCDEAAINAIVQTKFKPGKQRGKPVKVQVTIPVTFKL